MTALYFYYDFLFTEIFRKKILHACPNSATFFSILQYARRYFINGLTLANLNQIGIKTLSQGSRFGIFEVKHPNPDI